MPPTQGVYVSLPAPRRSTSSSSATSSVLSTAPTTPVATTKMSRRVSAIFMGVELPPPSTTTPPSLFHTPASTSRSSAQPSKRKLERTATNENIGRPLDHSVSKKARVDKPTALQPPTNRGTPAEAVASQLTATVPKGPPTKKRPRKVDCPPWLHIPHLGSEQDALDLVHLREFLRRFASLLNIAKAHIEALDTFATISELAARSIATGLLELLGEDESKENKRLIDNTIKRIKSGKYGLDAIIHEIRNIAVILSITLDDPYPLSSAPSRTTRTGERTVVDPIQLVPILNSLANEVLLTAMVREDLDEGVREKVGVDKKYFADVKNEKEKFIKAKEALNKQKSEGATKPRFDIDYWNERLKTLRSKHKLALLKLQVTHTTQIQPLALRYTPLGTDLSGRTYHALSHPPSYPGSGHKKPSPVDRAKFANMAYAIFVWGKKPDDAPSSSSDDDDEDEECWWGFHEAEDVRSLSKWLNYQMAVKAFEEDKAKSAEPGGLSTLPNPPVDVGDNDENGNEARGRTRVKLSREEAQIRDLVKGLEGFADFLDVRCS